MSRATWSAIGALALLACSGADAPVGNGSATAGPAGVGGSTAAAGGADGVGGSSGAVGGMGAGGEMLAPAFCFDGAIDVQGPSNGAYTATTPHYVLTAETTQARSEEMARMIEASWLAYAEYFDGEPSDAGPHTVKMYADYDAWVAGLLSDGITAPASAGGYYDPNGGVAYLYDQPTRYFTDTLLLHEVGHQYHHLRGGLSGQGTWFVEGLAEHISRHDWDGRCLRLGVLPLLTQEDYPAQALEELSNNGFDLPAIISESTSASRPVLWAIFHYFETADNAMWAEAFEAFRKDMDGGAADPLSAFNAQLGQASDHEAPLLAWLSKTQEPLLPVYLEWQHVGPGTVIGDSAYFSVARVKAPVTHFETSFDAPPTGGSAGVLLAYDDTDNWTGFVVNADGTASRFVMIAGSATWWGAGTACAPACPSYQLSVDYLTAGKADITINGMPFDSIDIDGTPAGGVAVNATRMTLRDMSWQ